LQGIGFIITAIIPYLAGVLRQSTGSFQSSWSMLIVTLFLMLAVTSKFSPAEYAQAMNPPND
jgi:CP family cyanate transporter-like MFS transporter